MFNSPYVRHLQNEGITFQISEDRECIAFVKRNAYAVLDNHGKNTAYWQNDRLMLNGITFLYGTFHNIEGNTVLKEYLSDLLGYQTKEKEDELD